MKLRQAIAAAAVITACTLGTVSAQSAGATVAPDNTAQVSAFLHFLHWADQYEWLAFAPDSAGNGNHIVYGGNVLDCIAVTESIPYVNGPGGLVPNQCIGGPDA